MQGCPGGVCVGGGGGGRWRMDDVGNAGAGGYKSGSVRRSGRKIKIKADVSWTKFISETGVAPSKRGGGGWVVTAHGAQSTTTV